MKIQQANPKASYLAYKEEIDTAVQDILDSGWYVLGQAVQKFEMEFAQFVGSRFAVGVASGTDAIELSLRALEIGAGDVVFTVSHTAVATVAGIERAGAIPYLVDVDPLTFTMDPDSLRHAIEDVCEQPPSLIGRAKAIIPVHIYGHPADMTLLHEMAERYDLAVVEDCAQAHGAAVSGRQVGTFGTTGAFSFYPTKNLGALGDGGIIVTSDESTYQRLRELRQYGWRERYVSFEAGINSRLDELQAAVLSVKLRHLAHDNTARQMIASRYDLAFQQTSLHPPVRRKGVEHVFHQYVVRHSTDIEEFADVMKLHEIGTGVHYPLPVHLHPAYQGRVGICSKGLPVTEQLQGKFLSLPMYPQLDDEMVAKICKTITTMN